MIREALAWLKEMDDKHDGIPYQVQAVAEWLETLPCQHCAAPNTPGCAS